MENLAEQFCTSRLMGQQMSKCQCDYNRDDAPLVLVKSCITARAAAIRAKIADLEEQTAALKAELADLASLSNCARAEVLEAQRAVEAARAALAAQEQSMTAN